jgi:hypothetical protein
MKGGRNRKAGDPLRQENGDKRIKPFFCPLMLSEPWGLLGEVLADGFDEAGDGVGLGFDGDG